MEQNQSLAQVSGPPVATKEQDCVPFFKSDQTQIRFEFGYLVALLMVMVALVIATHFLAPLASISSSTKALINAAAGGILGGWAFDTKWFYRVTARGRDNRYPFRWERHKFYWRVLTPYLAGLVAFTVYLLASSGLLPIIVADPMSSRAAFGLCFLLGYFSDIALTRCAKWVESMIPESK